MTVKMQQRRLKSESHYEVDEAWDEDLHSLIGADWPCPQRQHLAELGGGDRNLCRLIEHQPAFGLWHVSNTTGEKGNVAGNQTIRMRAAPEPTRPVIGIAAVLAQSRPAQRPGPS